MTNEISAKDVAAIFGSTEIDGPPTDADRVSRIAIKMKAALQSEDGKNLLARRRAGMISKKEYLDGIGRIMKERSQHEQ